MLFKIGPEAIPLVSSITGLAEDEICGHLYKIDVADCPGFLLRMALLRAIKTSDKKYAPSDWVDVNHIVYAPYVDIFYSDKRTLDFLEKETRAKSFRLEKSLIANISRNVPLEDAIMDISGPV